METLDPFDSGRTEVPYDEIADMRQRCPIAHLATGFYFASRHDDVAAGLRDGGPRVKTFTHEGKMRALDVVVPEDGQLTGEIEGPRHTRLRQLLMTALHQRLVSASEPFVREVSRSLLDDMIERGSADLITDYAVPIPSQVLAHIIGLPREDFVQFRQWSEEVVNGPYATQNKSERGEGLKGAHPEFSQYIDDLADDRRANPRDDLISRMVHAQIDGAYFSETQTRSSVAHLIMAGNETTTNLIGNMLRELLTTPDLLARIRADRTLIPELVEESLRHDPPVLIQPRTTVVDVEMRDVRVPRGSRVVFSIAGANRDGAVFNAPDDFRIDRPNAKDHLAFGAGPHFCPGAPLARLEGRVAIEEFVDRVDTATLEPGHKCAKIKVFWANGPESLPVRLVGAPSLAL
jgi:cytochrome P450